MKRHELDAPGAGLPQTEQALLGYLLRIGSLGLSNRRALRMFVREAKTILELVDELDLDELSTPVLVPRLTGIEDSSRNWSVLMVLDHLNQVNASILQVIQLLQKQIRPDQHVSIADFKPDPDVDSRVTGQFMEMNDRFEVTLEQRIPLTSRVRFDHPWFGGLTAHQWLCLAAVHMRIHRKQARKITTTMGLA